MRRDRYPRHVRKGRIMDRRRRRVVVGQGSHRKAKRCYCQDEPNPHLLQSLGQSSGYGQRGGMGDFTWAPPGLRSCYDVSVM